MSGLPMNSFLQKMKAATPKFSPWTNLFSLFARNYLSYIDLALAEEILKVPTKENEAVAALLCHLSAASRQGHLCLSVTADAMTPPLVSLWEGNRDEPERPGTAENDWPQEARLEIEELIRRGCQDISSDICTLMMPSEENPKSLQTFVCQVGTRYYFQRHWYYETLFFQHFQRLSKMEPIIQFDCKQIHAKVKELQALNKLLPEQAEAIINCSQHALTIIAGGPGTGKTYTAGLLVGMLCASLPIDLPKPFEIALAAPTGKAAANLQKSLLKDMQGLSYASQIQAKTLHSLLGLKGAEFSNEPLLPLSSDLVIVDESSMIDSRLMALLFSSIKPGARLILLGDPFQLPAVESGSIFADLVNASRLPGSSMVELKKCVRAELKEIVDFAAAIKMGDSASCLQILEDSVDNSGVHRLTFDPGELRSISAHALPFYRANSIISETPHCQLKHFDRFRILSPFRKGPYGVESINSKILKELQKEHPAKAPFITPIILVRNAPRHELFNGEAGVLVRMSPTSEAFMGNDFAVGDYALFPSSMGHGEVRKIPALLLPAFEYAFCLSVHKSQGSEFDRVLFLLPEGSDVFGREVIYTAVTRARKRLDLWDQPGALNKALARQSTRFSGLAERLNC